MKLWRKNNRIEKELPTFLRAGLNRFNGRLMSIANYLQQRTNNYSLRKKKVLLFLFVIVFLTESSVVLVQGIARKSKSPISVTRIKTIPVESSESATPHITKAEFLKIKKFKNYIDSLSTTAEGIKHKDSLLHNRPQLMDSVNFLINLFLEQSKTLAK
jgi:hypothetical protein